MRPKADGGPVSSGLGHVKKPVNPLSVGFVRFAQVQKRPEVRDCSHSLDVAGKMDWV
jgi:hypothetical protein